MRKFSTILFFWVFIFSASGQSSFWEGGLFLGGSAMGGDLVDAKLGSTKDAGLAYGLMLRRYLSPNLAVRTNLLQTRLTGDDSRYDRLADRGFRSRTPLTELSVDLELDILGHRKNKVGSCRGVLSPYLFWGIGVAFAKPEPFYGLRTTTLDQNAAYSTTRFVMPLGAGLRINVNPSWALALEVAPRATFSDYLDGISLAGNPDKNDWYGFGSVQLFYRLSKPDRDGDGIADSEDACPEIAGTELAMGCPDRDNDGLADNRDQCPDIPGAAGMQGCPDSDNDGVQDSEDGCPTQTGTKATNGCPDRDQDGLADGVDNCPDQAGPAASRGCPETDSDKDGLLDHQDDCPDTFGPSANKGCPYPDRDADGIPDTDDRCPDVSGSRAKDGCPEEKIEQQAQDVLDFATRNVRFASDQADLLPASLSVLDEVAKVLRDYPAYKLRIEGFTDSRGTETHNQQLSEARARRCYDHLISSGIAADRMQYAGFGAAKPVATNETEAGRLQNRRVEFTLFR